MADTESIGGISVSIGGDISPLVAAGAKATQVSAQIGSNVAGAFNTAAAGANQFDAAMQALTASTEAQATASALATQAGTGLTRGFSGLGEGALNASFRMSYLIRGIKDVAEGRGAFAMAELSNELVILGPLAIAAGASLGVLAAAFIGPIKAAKELQAEIDKTDKEVDDSLDKTLDHIEHTNVELQRMQFGAAAGGKLQGFYTDQAAQRDLSNVRSLNDEIQSMEKRASGFHASDLVPYFGAKARADEQKEIVDKQAEQAKLQEQIDAKHADLAVTQAQTAKDAASEAGKNTAARIANEEAANKQFTEIYRARSMAQIEADHAAQQQRIQELASEYERVVAEGEEEKRYAGEKAQAIKGYALGTRDTAIGTPSQPGTIERRAGAEAAGKDAVEQAGIQIKAQGEIAAAKRDYTQTVEKADAEIAAADQKAALSVVEANRRVTESLNQQIAEGWNRVDEAARKTVEEVAKATSKDIQTQVRVGEVQTKGQGRADELRIERSLIALEAQYDEQTSHSAQQQINYARQKAALESQARQAKLIGLQAELATAKADEDTANGEVRVAEIEQQIAQLKQQNANADAKEALAVQELHDKLTEQLSIQEQITNAKNAAASTAQTNQLAIGTQLGQAIGNLPKHIGDDIGGAISDSLLTRHPGKSIGQEMAKELTDALKSTLGSILKQGLSSLFQIGLGFLGFADGTDSAPGGIAMVGEKGPEIMHVPRGAQIIPNHKIKGYADGIGLGSARSDASTSSRPTVAFGDIHFHAHGVSNPRQFADMAVREIPGILKARSPQFSPYAK